jgi:hypothetical protein
MRFYEACNLICLATSVVRTDHPEIILLFDFHSAIAMSTRMLKRNSCDFIDVAQRTTNEPSTD